MPPLKRKAENAKLPARWVMKHGAYYYLVPPSAKAMWDGKTWFRLGNTLPEAYRIWAERVSRPQSVTTISTLLDRYMLEVVPTKAPKTASENMKQIERLRPVFGGVALTDLEPQHVYQYVDKRTAKTSKSRSDRSSKSRFALITVFSGPSEMARKTVKTSLPSFSFKIRPWAIIGETTGARLPVSSG